ncbi:mechanosensitive ion channel family protein [Sphingomonas sp.]|uniref:mechanosensitive ion channel family protein n=1 Tax=Sphingomonas sp. TaxID=28214 RepID=UPI002DB8F62E|nr:mechanosensitive ion channel domain-containing protein [Sphingomonas sp.]HEU4968378.1 mechanosensitive ion channel domain-containing protein [Sphingomonas sp.]
MERLAATLPSWLATIALVAGAVLVALALHWIALNLARRAAARSSMTLDDMVIRRICAPLRWLLVGFALSTIRPALALDAAGLRAWDRVAGLVFPGLVGWMAVAALNIAADWIRSRADISTADNLRARRRRTRADILHRVGMFLILLVTFCMMLMSIPGVRNIGVTLIASAGLAALAVGAAAQPALKNLISGLQMAFTEPIRIDDVVVIEGEWGRIEEIRLTYVVVKVWDERRLIVPVSKFLEDSFQNWTRTTSQILGSVFWYLDPAADIGRLRAKLGELVKANRRWDGRFCNLQVTDSKPEAIEVRALMTAKDASTAFDLRCDVREAMLAFIREQMPEAIVRYRGDLGFTRPEPVPT